jgi:hypothetical protein
LADLIGRKPVIINSHRNYERNENRQVETMQDAQPCPHFGFVLNLTIMRGNALGETKDQCINRKGKVLHCREMLESWENDFVPDIHDQE